MFVFLFACLVDFGEPAGLTTARGEEEPTELSGY
jgi:hypothetical protein